MKGIDPERAGWPRACRLGAQRPGRHTVYPARVRSSGEFTQAVIHVTDVRAAVEQMRGRGVQFEEYDAPGLKTVGGIADFGSERVAWFRDPDGNILSIDDAHL